MRLLVLGAMVFCNIAQPAGQRPLPTPEEIRGWEKRDRRECLKDFAGVWVFVKLAQADGDQEARLQTQVELRFRMAGIPMTDTDRILNLSSFYRHSGGALLRTLSAHVNESGFFKRTGRLHEERVKTWDSSVGGFEVVQKIDWDRDRDDLLAAVDEFINDYLAANPQTTPVKQDPKAAP